MTAEQIKEMYTPHWWNLYENGEFIDSFPSHSKAKKALHFKLKEANDDMLDLYYEIKPRDNG